MSISGSPAFFFILICTLPARDAVFFVFVAGMRNTAGQVLDTKPSRSVVFPSCAQYTLEGADTVPDETFILLVDSVHTCPMESSVAGLGMRSLLLLPHLPFFVGATCRTFAIRRC